MVEAHAAAGSLTYVYISGDQTHVRNLGALLMAEEAVRALNAQGILTGHGKPVGGAVDGGHQHACRSAASISGNMLDKSFMLSSFKDVSGTITITAPANYAVSTNGTDWGPSATIACDAAWVGSVVSVQVQPDRFDRLQRRADHRALDHHARLRQHGPQRETGRDRADRQRQGGRSSGTPATATWPMFSGTAIVLGATTEGAIGGHRRHAERPREQERQLRRGALRHTRRHVAGRRRPQPEPLRRVRGPRDRPGRSRSTPSPSAAARAAAATRAGTSSTR